MLKSLNKWINENNLRGEYWIDEGGGTYYADGDVGDYNHEAHVINIVSQSVAEQLEDYDGTYDEVDLDHLLNFIDENELEDQIDPNELEVLYGSVDAREYAMKHWGWKRVVNHDVETWNASPADLKTIGSGLGDIMSQEGIFDAPENVINQMEFYVYSYATGQSKTYTLSQLENGGMSPDMPTMQLPSQTAIAMKNQGQTNIARNQLKDIDLQGMHPYYQGKTFPFGDHVIGFKHFMQMFD